MQSARLAAPGIWRPFPAAGHSRLRGEMAHKNVWLIDLASGAERQVTDFGPDFVVRDFDISPDGREIVVEQVQDQSDIVLIERQQR